MQLAEQAVSNLKQKAVHIKKTLEIIWLILFNLERCMQKTS